MSGLTFAPLFAPLFLWVIGGLAMLVSLYSMLNSPLAGAFRLLAAGLLMCLLLQPRLLNETASALPDIALIVSDQSASQSLDGRSEITAEATEVMTSRIAGLEGMEVRTVTATGDDETRLGDALREGLSDIPRQQLAGVFIISDGQTVDTPEDPQDLGIPAPIHLMLTGREDEKDRVLDVLSAPRFGIINEAAKIRFKVADYGLDNRLANVTLKVNGTAMFTQPVRVGEEIAFDAPLAAPGKTVIELIAATAEGELTSRNNRAVIQISVIRDRLRVLLVSGEPHAGERVWRNLLKSDPAVDLIHFTILKPFDKNAEAGRDDLALIQFPENELFLEKLNDFDVLIFDRYTYRGVMRSLHFDNISRYVENGGAMLIATGPEFTGRNSLAVQRNLAYILPALPDGSIDETPFIPLRTDLGQRHPVTENLSDEARWGRWLRTIGVSNNRGNVLMTGADDAPLLIVDRVKRGRVGLLLSDHVWLWARGFDGGGPHRELLRRLVHWLMKEPELEEEALSLGVRPGESGLTLTRRSLEDEVAPVILTAPDGSSQEIALSLTAPGRWATTVETSDPGLYTATTQTSTDETLFDVAALGLAAPPEYKQVLATQSILAPLVQASGGGVYQIRLKDTLALPAIRRVREGRPATGRGTDTGWAGLVRRDAERVENISTRPLLAPWAWMLLIGGAILAGWLLEGRRLSGLLSAARSPAP